MSKTKNIGTIHHRVKSNVASDGRLVIIIEDHTGTPVCVGCFGGSDWTRENGGSNMVRFMTDLIADIADKHRHAHAPKEGVVNGEIFL